MSPATLTVVDNAVSDNGRNNEACVGQIPLSDYERELAITRAARLTEFFHAEQEAALALYEAHGGFDAIGAAHRARSNADSARRLMEALISNRRPGFVAQLEEERGLA